MVESPLHLGRYRLRGALGHGGFATVYRAYDPLLDREVALKALSSELAAEAEDRSRFLNEARALASLHHEHVVTVYDVGEEDGRPFFTMELLPGETLADRLHGRGRLSVAETLTIVEQVAAALDCVHAAGLVHRDVKDSNVMLVRNARGGEPRAVLMDFGVALSGTAQRLTGEGIGLGTPAYVAPEQIDGDQVGPAADVYALGILTYQLLSGAPPFVGDTAHVLYAHAHLPPPDLNAIRPELPASLSNAVAAALAKDPNARPAGAGAFAASLRRAARRGKVAMSAISEAGVTRGMRLNGSGPSVQTVRLDPGVHGFRIERRSMGGLRFRVLLLDAAAGAPDVLAATTGPYTGTAWRRVREGGDFTLRIEGEGAWTISVL